MAEEDELRALAYRQSKARQAAAKAAAEAALAGNPALALALAANYAPLVLSHPDGVPLIGHEND